MNLRTQMNEFPFGLITRCESLTVQALPALEPEAQDFFNDIG